MEFEQLRKAINDSTVLGQSGKNQEGLDLLDKAIALAIHDGDARAMRTLSLHASVIAHAIGDLPRVARYCEECLKRNPGDAMALYRLAQISSEREDADRARHYAEQSYKAALQSEREIDRLLREEILREWPELGSSR